MPEGAAIGVLLCVLVILVAVETLLGAVFLRAAVALYNLLAFMNNWMAGGASSPGSVPEPALGKAMRITFEIFLAQVVLGALVFFITDAGATPAGAREQLFGVAVQVLSFPVSLLIRAEMLSARLPTTFGRAFRVTLCYLLLVLVVVGVLVGIVVLVFGVALRGA
jgi:hypothetical protein